jgi:hypothetical protein
MNKILLFLITSSLIAFSSYAQTKSPVQLSIGGEFGLPTGQTSNVFGSAIGVSAKLELPVSASAFNFVITTGISDFLVKYYYTGPSVTVIFITPIEVGGKYYFSKIGYIEGDLGVASDNYNYQVLDADGTVATKKVTNAAFIYSPVIGFTAPTKKHKGTVDIGLRYEGRAESGATVSQLALRIAYRFGLKK